MVKTLVMLGGLAAFAGASVACFGMFSDRPAEESCEGLTGQARADCEQRKAATPR
jgi:hypothetical protein